MRCDACGWLEAVDTQGPTYSERPRTCGSTQQDYPGACGHVGSGTGWHPSPPDRRKAGKLRTVEDDAALAAFLVGGVEALRALARERDLPYLARLEGDPRWVG